MIEFKKLAEFERGTLYHLLCESYSELLKAFPDHTEEYKQSWKTEDDNTFNYPDTIGKCVLVSVLNNEPIGFVSWDPRNIPEEGIIGQNCILPAFRGKGYGKKQIEKVIEIFQSASTRVIKVTTADLPFFMPAQKTYLSCNFKINKHINTEAFGGLQLIEFEYKGDIK
ncbi:MAG: GNAT family N-acetyltransferase [Ignavibacteriaceae bacterium]